MKLVSISKRSIRGFTLIELVISLSIMMVMTGLLLFNYPESAVRVTLINSVQSTVLLIREAQVRGSAIDSVNSSFGGYGVFLKIEDSNTNSTVKLFGDSVSNSGSSNSSGLPIGNGLYEISPIDETNSTLSLPIGFRITKFCVGLTPSTCYSDTDSSLTISFTRPSPRPDIYLNGLKTTNYGRACIELQSKDPTFIGHIRSIEVYNSGMISTTLSACS